MIQFLREQQLTLSYLVSTLAVITIATQLGARFDLAVIVMLGVISPLILAVVFSAAEKGWQGVRAFFDHPPGFQCPLLAAACALLIPFAFMILSIGVDRGQWVLPEFAIMPAKLPILLLLMTGEEYGWRRYAFDRLQGSASFMPASAVVTLVWLFWHYPGYLIGMGTPEQMPFWLFALMLIPASILICFLYRWTRNIYLVILAHISSNMAFNTLPFLPEVTGTSSAFVIYTALLWLLAAPLILNKKFWP